jgi:hypothetical protein
VRRATPPDVEDPGGTTFATSLHSPSAQRLTYASLNRRTTCSVFMAGVKMGNTGYRGKRRDGLGRRKGTNGCERLVFVVGDKEESVELHDGEEIADDGLDVEDNDLAAFGFDAAFEAHEDGDA